MIGLKYDMVIRAIRPDYDECISVACFTRKGSAHSDVREAAQPLTFAPINEGEYVHGFMQLSPGQAATLMDDLWACGVRPTEAVGSVGQLSATQAHLQDMRKLVFEQKP